MKLGLHAYTLMLAAGLREYRPVGRGALAPADMLEKVAKLGFHAVQLSRHQIPFDDLVALASLGHKAQQELHLEIHLSTGILQGEHLVEMIYAAHNMGARVVTANLACLHGNVKERQQRLEGLLADLDTAIKRAERYGITLLIENGHHTAAADLAAFIQAAQSPQVGVCFDMGNPLSVPEDPLEAAQVLAPYTRSAHIKDLQVFRTEDGVTLVNCPVGEGVVDVTAVLKRLKEQHPHLPVFLQTAAERLEIPLLSDQFLTQYPRITARALAGLLRKGALVYDLAALTFPHERKASEREVLRWEDDRLKRSLHHVHTLLGTASLTLALE